MVMAMEKPASHSGDVALERMAIAQVAAFVPSTSYPARAVAATHEEPAEELADIEIERLRNIERNKEILRQLGLA